MTENKTPFFYRESVQAYFDSAEVRFAVDQLLARKMKYVPQSFDAGEVADFYRACLAARQTQIDFVQDMIDLWHLIWPDLGKSWHAAPYDPGDEELTLDPQVRWDESYFQRSFDRKGKGIRAALWVYLSSKSPAGSEIKLGYSLFRGAQSLARKANRPEGWSWDNDYKCHRFSTESGVSQNDLTLAPFVDAAQRAVSVIEAVAQEA